MHSTFTPHGVNANFVERIGPKSLRMRTYERGVEAETLACGTGSVACSVVGAVTLGLRSPVAVHTRSGDILRVHFNRAGASFSNVVLEGPVALSYTGEILV
jgi:diaminopimelate epimerase